MARRSTPPGPAQPVTRDDLERGFLSIQRGVQREVDDRKSMLLTIAGGAALVLTIIVFLLGRKSGKKKTTFVEIRRV